MLRRSGAALGALCLAISSAHAAPTSPDVLARLEKLEKEAHRLASVMYQNAPGGAPGAPPGSPGGDGAAAEGGEKKKDVIDAEFEESN